VLEVDNLTIENPSLICCYDVTEN